MLYEGGTFLEVVNSIWLFFQDQILGMKWLNGLIGNGLSQLGLDIRLLYMHVKRLYLV